MLGLQLLVLLLAGVGSLVVHELGHVVAYRLLVPEGDWRMVVRRAAVSVEVDPVPTAIRRSVIAISGPMAGALTVLAIGLASSTAGVMHFLATLHLTMLLPIFADGRQLLLGLRESASGRLGIG